MQQYTVTRGDVEVTVTAIGTVEADQVTRLSFTSAGRIVALPFEVGDSVRAGDVLAQLNDEPQRIAYEQALLALELAQVQKDNLLAGPDEAQIRIAEANVQKRSGGD